MLRQSYDNVICLLIGFKILPNTDFSFLNKNENNNDINNIYENKIREKHLPKRKESKNIVYSNSANDYLNNNNMNNKKNINIHEITKFIQKLKSSDSDSSLLLNELKKYSSKPIMNLYIKTSNKSDKYISLNSSLNSKDNQSNHNMNLTLGYDKRKRKKRILNYLYK